MPGRPEKPGGQAEFMQTPAPMLQTTDQAARRARAGAGAAYTSPARGHREDVRRAGLDRARDLGAQIRLRRAPLSYDALRVLATRGFSGAARTTSAGNSYSR